MFHKPSFGRLEAAILALSLPASTAVIDFETFLDGVYSVANGNTIGCTGFRHSGLSERVGIWLEIDEDNRMRLTYSIITAARHFASLVTAFLLPCCDVVAAPRSLQEISDQRSWQFRKVGTSQDPSFIAEVPGSQFRASNSGTENPNFGALMPHGLAGSP